MKITGGIKDYVMEQMAEDRNPTPPPFPDLRSFKIPDRREFSCDMEYLIAYTCAVDASDLHVKSRSIPYIRKGGLLVGIPEVDITDENIFDFVMANVRTVKVGNIGDTERTYDFSFSKDQSRFRCNAYHDIYGWCLAIRHLNLATSDFSSLGIPNILKRLVMKKDGLILITGPTGSGKSTTLTCLIDYINTYERKHIIMLEDPIEYIHNRKNCIISQREIGRDTVSYEQAIIEALREDPDVIMIGEMRDLPSIEAALRAAETGHMVLSTLHTRGAASTINRIIDVFPVNQQQIRTQLAMCLTAAVSQQLVPSKRAGQMCLATEVMIANNPVRAMIRENKVYQINNAIQMGLCEGMNMMSRSIEDLYNNGKISDDVMREYINK